MFRRSASRRQFLQTIIPGAATLVAACPAIVPSTVFGARAPSNRITMGFVGLGRGHGFVMHYCARPEAQVLAVCDVQKGRCENTKGYVDTAYGNHDCVAYNDFRELIGRNDIDAVLNYTPTHWHAIISVAALDAGKDVFCEKPLGYTVAEGRAICDAVRRNHRVFLAGTQYRTYPDWSRWVEVVRNGLIGKLQRLVVMGGGMPRDFSSAVRKWPRSVPVPEGTDFDLWLGPAPDVEHFGQTGQWMVCGDYATGWMAEFGVHPMDNALWGYNPKWEGVVELEGQGTYDPDPRLNTALTYDVNLKFPDGVTMLFSDTTGDKGGRGWTTFYGTDGFAPSPDPALATFRPTASQWRPDLGGRDFLECVRSRRTPYATAEDCQRATTLVIISDIATRLGRKLRFDLAKEQFLGDETANRMLSRPMRSPWRLAGCLVVLLLALVMGAPLHAVEPTLANEDVLRRLPAWQMGGDTETPAALTALVKQSLKDANSQAVLAGRLAQTVGDGAATVDAKRLACRHLRLIAGPAQVPALAALLTDKDLGEMARYALEPIPDASAGRALLVALPKASPLQKVGIINSLGQRGETAAVGPLAHLAEAAERAVAGAAVAALGRIGTTEAATALQQAKASCAKMVALISRAQLVCAEKLRLRNQIADAGKIYQALTAPTEGPEIRSAAVAGLLQMLPAKDHLPKILDLLADNDRAIQVVAAEQARQSDDARIGNALAEKLPTLSPYGQMLVLGVLADRRESVALAAVLEAARSKEEAVAIAALVALGQVGDASVVPALAREAASASLSKIEELQPKGPVGGAMVSIVPFVDFSRGNAARSSLIALKPKDIDAAILRIFDGADAKTKSVLASVLAARLAETSVPSLLRAAGDNDSATRMQSIKALGVLGREKDLPAVIEIYLRVPTDAEKAAAAHAISVAVRRIEDRERRADAVLAAYTKADDRQKVALLEVLSFIICRKSLDTLREAIRSGNDDLYAAAFRGLTKWPDLSAATDLRALATGAKTETFKTLALRAYIGLAAKAESEKAMAAMFADAARLVQGKEEKLLLLSGLQNHTSSTAAVELIAPYLTDVSVQEEAARAAAVVADRVKEKDRSAIKAIMRKVPAATRDVWVRGVAKAVIERP